MPARKKDLKTYSNNNKSKLDTDIMHNILGKPIQKKKTRRKAKIEIKELPLPSANNLCLTNNSSLKLNSENTFDRLLNATDYNKVSYKSVHKEELSRSLSKSSFHIDSHIYSPVRLKRKRKRRNKVAHEILRSPILTRSLKSHDSTFNTGGQMKNTLERSVNESLFIEKETNIQQPTFNYVISDTQKQNNSVLVCNDSKENNIHSVSYEHIFSDRLIQKYNNLNTSFLTYINPTVSSTPVKSIRMQKVIDETLSPISNASINKPSSPELKMRSTKTRQLKLPGCVNNLLSQNEQENLNIKNSNNTSELVKEILDKDSYNTIVIYKNRCNRDVSKLWLTPVVNITNYSSFMSIVNNPKINLDKSVSLNKHKSHVRTRKPLADLTNKDLQLRSKAQISNDYAKLNDRVALVNITIADIESYLDNYCATEICETAALSLIEDIHQPFVNLTNINVKKYLDSKYTANHINNDSKSSATSVSCDSTKFSDNLSTSKVVNSDNDIVESDRNGTKFVKELLINLTNIDIKNYVDTSEYKNMNMNKDKDNSNIKQKRASTTKNLQESLPDMSQVECSNDLKWLLEGSYLNATRTKLGPYITLRNRLVFPKIISRKRRNRSKNLASDSSIDKSNNTYEEKSIGSLLKTSENLSKFSILSSTNDGTSSCQHSLEELSSLQKHETTDSNISLSDESLHPAHIEVNTPNNKKNNGSIVNSKTLSQIKGFGNEEIKESIKRSRDIHSKWVAMQNNCKELNTNNNERRNVKDRIRKSLFQSDHLLEDFKTTSPDLFDDFELSKMNLSVLQVESLDSLSNEVNLSCLSSVIECSYIDSLDKNRECPIYSLNRNKRNRISKFGQTTKVEHILSEQKQKSRSPISSFNFIIATPVRITKRRKVYFTPRTNFIAMNKTNIDSVDIENAETLHQATTPMLKSSILGLGDLGEVPMETKKSLQSISANEQENATKVYCMLDNEEDLKACNSLAEENVVKKTNIEETSKITGEAFNRLSSITFSKSKISKECELNHRRSSSNEVGHGLKLGMISQHGEIEKTKLFELDDVQKLKSTKTENSKLFESALKENTVNEAFIRVSQNISNKLKQLEKGKFKKKKTKRNQVDRRSSLKLGIFPEPAQIGQTGLPSIDKPQAFNSEIGENLKAHQSVLKESAENDEKIQEPLFIIEKEFNRLSSNVTDTSEATELSKATEQIKNLSSNVIPQERTSKLRTSNRRKQSENDTEENLISSPNEEETNRKKSLTLGQEETSNFMVPKAVGTRQTADEIPRGSRKVEFAVPTLPPIKLREKLKKNEEELVLKAGKLWRRSLVEVRNSKFGLCEAIKSPARNFKKGDTIDTCPDRNSKIENTPSRRLSVRVVPLPCQQEAARNTTVLESYAVACRKSFITNVLQDKSLLEECFENLSLTRDNTIINLEDDSYNRQEVTVTARDVVFRKCGQTEPLPFEKCYPNSILQNCQKIGEGVYGEVFLFRRPNGGTSVMKVIPIEGALIVNGERQKKFEEILSEITIAIELSSLRNNSKNNTNGFTELHKVTCVKGKYPARLIELWELFDEVRRSENDHPDIFEEDQLYVVLELANGGNDLESFVFNNAQQALALITQIACALAVAECSLEFEHRDLHWGNVLISRVGKRDTVSFCLDGQKVVLDTHGVCGVVIDFTLSRISYDGVCIYNDLALDPDMFTACGDYQFEVYRLMRKQNRNEWQHFEPYTNVLWLHYLLEKAISGLRYKNKNTKVHKTHIMELIKLKDDILEYKSAEEFVIAHFINKKCL